MKNKKGFTLIELLAVIVILGLLMAIAIPSVTKYITESRKKTVTSTIGNYIGALVNDVNDLSYTFTEANTIYAVPIECIALERGGTNPFGEWHQSNDAYWAYVLVQYDDNTSSYTYGYTFKDSAGYGLYPTAQSKLNENGKQIQTGLSLSRPKNGKVTTITDTNNWNGFKVDDSTDLVVLVSESEGNVGDGKTTCTLQQKGDNYAQAEAEKAQSGSSLVNLIKENNQTITATPTLTTTSSEAGENGLYSSTDTTTGKETYYFRGNVDSNYVKFAGQTWRIIRINEDRTIRLMLSEAIGNTRYKFNTTVSSYTNMYYSNSDMAKPTVDSWYQTNIVDKGYDSYVATGTFCEQAKVKNSTSATSGNATMEVYSSYTPNFKCTTDGNGKGILDLKVGLITYDEVIFAGGYYGKATSTYLYLDEDYTTSPYSYFTMSPAGFYYVIDEAYSWGVLYDYGEYISHTMPSNTFYLRPVVNLKSDVLATGNGEKDTPYVIQTK